jgi:hypothetical protein
MKRFLATTALLGLSLSLAVADQSVLIDFNLLQRDTQVRSSTENDEHGGTLIDFSSIAGSGFGEDERKEMRISLAIRNWDVVLSSSARTIENQTVSLTREVTVSQTARPFNGEEIAGKQVMGVRVHFPEAAFHAFARVDPPFEIPVFGDANDPTQFHGFGVISNVGIIKQVDVTLFGSNYPHGFAVVLIDASGVEQEIFMGNLKFDGWRTMVWRNPNYIADVRHREISRLPLYPNNTPLVKLGGFIIYRDGLQVGGDAVTYIKDINVTYDRANVTSDRDIVDESVWGILEERQAARASAELQRLGNSQVLRFLEAKKLDTTIQ